MTNTVSKKRQPLCIGTTTLGELSTRVPVPSYDREQLKTGIVHMSVGGFHRSHEALYLNDYLTLNPSDWMITGVGLLPTDEKNIAALSAQDSLYTVLERSADRDIAQIIGSIKNVLHAPQDPDSVFKALAEPNVKILSLTVTEKGYCYNKAQELDFDHPSIKEDLANSSKPQTAIGYAVRALNMRRQSGMDAFTVMSCDNLPGNGHITRRVLVSFAEAIDKDLAKWISDNVSFPNAMVDRITPVTTDSIRHLLNENFGIEDLWPVVCEDFKQWVLEDNFCAGRPDLERVGVQFVKDVEPYEKMKVRLLNGSHSALAYVSYLSGFRDVDAAMADPVIAQFVRSYMESDITPTVPAVPGIDLVSYQRTLISRFSNPAIRDQILRLAEDGSQKIKNAIVPCLEHQLKTNGSIKFAALALAGWFRFLSGTDEKGELIPLKDPMAETLKTRARLEPRNPMHLLAIQEIFGPHLSSDERLRKEIMRSLESIHSKGMYQTLQEAVQS